MREGEHMGCKAKQIHDAVTLFSGGNTEVTGNTSPMLTPPLGERRSILSPLVYCGMSAKRLPVHRAKGKMLNEIHVTLCADISPAQKSPRIQGFLVSQSREPKAVRREGQKS